MRKMATLVLIGLLGFAACIGLAPYAFGQDSSNPLYALWDAIHDLQRHDDNLQAQIDELKTLRDDPGAGHETPLADPRVSVEIVNGSSKEFSIRLDALNDGPERAAGVRLTMFYKMSAIHVENISGEGCRDLSRGIIQCDLGTIEASGQSSVLVEARQIGEQSSTLTVDLSSTTTDADSTNNRYVGEIKVGSEEPAGADSEDAENAIPGPSDGQSGNETSTDTGSKTEDSGSNSTSSNEDEGSGGDDGGSSTQSNANQTSSQSDNPSSESNNSTATESQDSDDQSSQDTSSDTGSSDTGDSDSDSSSDKGEGSGGDDGDPTTQPNEDQKSDG